MLKPFYCSGKKCSKRLLFQRSDEIKGTVVIKCRCGTYNVIKDNLEFHQDEPYQDRIGLNYKKE